MMTNMTYFLAMVNAPGGRRRDNQALGTIERLFEAEFNPRESVV